MTIRRKVYDVHLNPPTYDPAVDPFDTTGITTHRVVVTHGDQLRGELEAGKRGLTLDAGQNVTSLILWLALKRTGVYTGRYEQFEGEVAALESVDPPAPSNPDGTPGEVGTPVPPTAVPSEPASGSHGTTPASSPTGSIPSSTSS